MEMSDGPAATPWPSLMEEPWPSDFFSCTYPWYPTISNPIPCPIPCPLSSSVYLMLGPSGPALCPVCMCVASS